MLQIYTDGGCRHNPGLGAWAFIVVADDKILHQQSASKPHTTNNEMELTAILKALEHLSDPSHLEYLSPIIIFSDSQYSIKTITEWSQKWIANNTLHLHKNSTIIENILFIYECMPNVELRWVKGHSTNPFNNLADRLVNEAMNAATVPSVSPLG